MGELGALFLRAMFAENMPLTYFLGLCTFLALSRRTDTAFGLGASVWTADRGRGEAVARRIAAGACFVNALVRSDVRLPFGGTKASGFGRELAEHGIHEFTNIKSVYVD